MDFIEGEIIYIDKPLHWTSFRVVRVIRAKLCQKLKIKKLKVGHAGTLDPLATGVMTCLHREKTKQIEALQAQTKSILRRYDWGQQHLHLILKRRLMLNILLPISQKSL